MINWKSAAKYYRRQFMLWAKSYNQIADVYMIGESWSVGSPCFSVTHLTKHATEQALDTFSPPSNSSPLPCP